MTFTWNVIPIKVLLEKVWDSHFDPQATRCCTPFAVRRPQDFVPASEGLRKPAFRNETGLKIKFLQRGDITNISYSHPVCYSLRLLEQGMNSRTFHFRTSRA
ncbi:hypothetical protein [Tardiphaga sp. P9-11]|uniref:hypothetical protein n=1 Tax=Tardiphaga sp. P9-11 TaxID=2024614 RepID=UPI0011F257B4|nr:hypothetical protein [Tardiphaga sp. P9-11]